MDEPQIESLCYLQRGQKFTFGDPRFSTQEVWEFRSVDDNGYATIRHGSGNPNSFRKVDGLQDVYLAQ